MCTKTANTDWPTEKLERIGPIALKLVALAACFAVFAPLLVAFALPFVR